MIWRWLFGSILGTLLIAITSPLFVRSYLPQTFDSVRGILVPHSGSLYRWRSEGYATTYIGPHGMPGLRAIEAREPDSIRMAIWGDSQAEGVCVADEDKLGAQIEHAGSLADQRLTAFPFARSGDDASDWLSQLPGVQDALDIDIHVLLIVELEDLVAAASAPDVSEDVPAKSRIAETFPDFAIHAARRLVTQDDGTVRNLRFAIGPSNADSTSQYSRPPFRDVDWKTIVATIAEVTDRRVLIVYAPQLPSITGGDMRFKDAADADFESMREAATGIGFTVVDVRDAMRESAAHGRWPHGFPNGRIGSGHLNATGYEIIADRIAQALQRLARQE